MVVSRVNEKPAGRGGGTNGPVWVSPQTDIDLCGGLWFKLSDLSDGAVASFTSHEGLAQVLTQGTGAAQPTKSSTQILFDGGDSLPRGSTGNTAGFVRRCTVPDSAYGMSPSGTGKGFTCTGLARVPGTNNFWMGNHGDTSAARNGAGPWAPSLMKCSYVNGVLTNLQEIAVAPLIANAESIQGLAWDASDSTLWFTIATGSAIGVYHINPNTGVLINDGFTASWAPNGLARVASSDKVWITEESGVGANIESRSLSTGAVVNAATGTGLGNLDMLFYDDTTGGLLLSNGSNGSAGSVRCLSTSGTSGALVACGDIQLDTHADCVEGIVWEGTKLYVLSDSYYHGGADGLNQLVEYTIVPPFAMDVSVHLRGQVTSIPSGADSYIEVGNGADGPLAATGTGFGIYDASATTMTAAIAEGTHNNVISGVTVPNLTSAFRTISLVMSKTNNLATLYVDGSSVGTVSLSTHVGGIPTAGLMRLGAGNNASRLFNGGLKDVIIVCGVSNRDMTETYLATT